MGKMICCSCMRNVPLLMEGVRDRRPVKVTTTDNEVITGVMESMTVFAPVQANGHQHWPYHIVIGGHVIYETAIENLEDP